MEGYIPGIMAWAAGILSLGTFQWLNTRKANKKIAEAQANLASTQTDVEEWHLYKEQLDIANNRIIELLKMNQEKENRFVEQTQRLRDTQARELEANERAIKLGIALAKANANLAETERKLGEANVRLSNNECIKHNCLHRDPPNEHTKKAIALARQNTSIKDTHDSTD